MIGLFEEPDDEGCIVDYSIDDASLQVRLSHFFAARRDIEQRVFGVQGGKQVVRRHSTSATGDGLPSVILSALLGLETMNVGDFFCGSSNGCSESSNNSTQQQKAHVLSHLLRGLVLLPLRKRSPSGTRRFCD